MASEERLELYREAVKQWGEDAQLNMAVEELAELISALQHLRRKSSWGHQASMDEVIDEVADVEIMLEQVKYMLNISDKAILDVQEKKLDRLVGLLYGGQDAGTR